MHGSEQSTRLVQAFENYNYAKLIRYKIILCRNYPHLPNLRKIYKNEIKICIFAGKKVVIDHIGSNEKSSYIN